VATSLDTDMSDAVALTNQRRDFHRFAEPGWCEVRTASLVARKLADLGFDLAVGRDVLAEPRMGLPSMDELRRALEFALSNGADKEFAALLADGYTGVVGTIRGAQPGPTVALRFDIDANYGFDRGVDSGLADYRSINDGVHHSCGHDAHTAIGLAVAAEVVKRRDDVAGEIRFVFQPAEEGLRGGRSMVAAGVVKDVSYLLGCHIGVQALKTGEIICGYNKILASEKFDVRFAGRNAHAGISPHRGRNALQAAAVAVQNLLAISRHGDGETRVNVGRIEGGEARNSVPASAQLQGEIRADDSTILAYMHQRVEAVVRGAAEVAGVEVDFEHVGGAGGASSDAGLMDIVGTVAASTRGVTSIRREADFKASDDMSCFMTAVQEVGGQAVYFGLGSELADVHHAPGFDIDDAALRVGRDIFLGCLGEIGALT
jgi:aminobenzoyl-glutamate utilization protein A